jgi:hypothetical protein
VELVGHFSLQVAKFAHKGSLCGNGHPRKFSGFTQAIRAESTTQATQV